MLNEEIIGGLVSALSRGQSLESAMMTFYNAGYNKEEIEDSAKEVYNQVGPQMMGVKGSLQETLNEIAIKAGVAPTTPAAPAQPQQANTPEKIVLQTPGEKKPGEVVNAKEENKTTQGMSNYTGPQSGNYQNSAQIADQIQEAIKGLRPVNIPSKIEIINKNIDETKPQVIQHVSDYSSQKSVNKAVTYILIAILLLLLIALGAVFLFKDDLIKLFNNLGLA
jgi:hypothetical protein